jgi:hypothetical protein
VNECTQQLGRVSPEHGYGPTAGAEAREKAAYVFGQDVTPRYRVVELVGTMNAVDAANEMRRRLEQFRDRVTKGDRPPSYDSDDYRQAYEPFQKARDKFIATARSDLATR